MALRKAGKALGLAVPVVFGGTAAAYRWKSRVELPAHEMLDLRDRCIVLTGGTTGIGHAVARDLLKRGAHVIVGCRDNARGASLRDELQHLGNITTLELDLTDPQSISLFATNLRTQQSVGVHGVINCAAEIRCANDRTKTGVDMTFASNHLGPQQLLDLLTPQLLRAANQERHARIVLVGSRLERKGIVDIKSLAEIGISDPAMAQSFDPMKNYAASKLANMLLASELHQRLSASNVDVFVVTPGMVHTNLWRGFPAWYRTITYPVRAAFLRSPEEAARGVVYAVAARELEGVGGKYLSDGKVIEPSDDARDGAKAAALYDLCGSLIQRAL